MNKLLTLFTLLASLLAFNTVSAANNNGYDPQKVVYHINYHDTKRSIGAMRNAQNHINALGEGQYQITFVLHGNGVELLRSVANESEKAAQMIDSLRSQDVAFNVCNNTLVGRNIALDDLYFATKSDVVPSGVAEIGKLQQQGFVYLRP